MRVFHTTVGPGNPRSKGPSIQQQTTWLAEAAVRIGWKVLSMSYAQSPIGTMITIWVQASVDVLNDGKWHDTYWKLREGK